MKKIFILTITLMFAVSVFAAEPRPVRRPKPGIRKVPAKIKKAPAAIHKPESAAIHKAALTKFTPTYLLAGHALKCYYSSDLTNWNTYEYGFHFMPNEIVAVNPSLFLMVGGSGKVLVTENACANWTTYNVGEDTNLQDVAYIEKDNAHPQQTPCFIAVGYKNDNAGIYLSKDNGKTWTKTKSATGDLKCCAASPDGKVIAIGDAGFFYSHDFGQTWQDASWPANHIPLTERIGNMYGCAWTTYPGPNMSTRNAFVFVCFSKRDEVRENSFRYSDDGSVWHNGSENLSTLSAYQQDRVLGENTVTARYVKANGQGRCITHPTQRGTYYSDDGGRQWKMYYQNMTSQTGLMMDVEWDGQKWIGITYNEGPEQSRYLATSADGENWSLQTVPKEHSHLAKCIAIGVNKK